MVVDKKIVYGLEELDAIVDYITTLMMQCTVFTFEGSLGAGKTTLVRALLRKCGITSGITSPTFNYVNRYENAQGQSFYHFDLYRIDTLDDFLAAGFDEYLQMPNSWSFIEWPHVVMSLLTNNVCHIKLDYHDDKRVATFTVVE